MIEQSPFSPEDLETQFLLFCLQGRFDSAALAMAQRMTEDDDFNWETAAIRIQRETLAPLLFSIVQGHDLFPAPLEAEIREIYLRNAVGNTLLFKDLAQLLEIFDREEVKAIVLKGAALAETVYGNIAVRPMADIDILVQKKDVDDALNLLTSSGYVLVDSEARPGITTAYENELLLQKSGRKDVLLELHWSLVDSPHYQNKIDMNWFWQSAEPAQFSDIPGLVLGPEALLLHLCSHIMLHHHGQGLLWLHDIAEVLDQFRSNLDWETLFAKAQAYDLVLSVQRILPLVSRQWNIELPAGIHDQINALRPSPREIKVFNWLTAKNRPVAQRFWVDLATSTSWRQRLEYAWHNLFPAPAYMRQRYHISHTPLLPFYYPYRWLLGVLSLFRR